METVNHLYISHKMTI